MVYWWWRWRWWLYSYPLPFFVIKIEIKLNITHDMKFRSHTKSWSRFTLNQVFEFMSWWPQSRPPSRDIQLTCLSSLVTHFRSIQLHHLYTCPLGREVSLNLPAPRNQCRPKRSPTAQVQSRQTSIASSSTGRPIILNYEFRNSYSMSCDLGRGV